MSLHSSLFSFIVAAILISCSWHVYSAPQRGVGLAYWDCADAIAVDVSWFYNWQPKHPCPGQTSIPWIPMIWGQADVQYAAALKNGNYEALLGFNEPDVSGQANMAVSAALNDWPKLMATNLRLGSPAATQWGAFSWTKQFMDGVHSHGYRVDFLCFHWYAYNDQNANNLRSFLNEVKSTYPGYKIWLTEFANATGNAQQNMDFFNGVYSLLSGEFADLVERYSWFTNREKNNVQGWDLIEWSNGHTTSMGNLYKSKPKN